MEEDWGYWQSYKMGLYTNQPTPNIVARSVGLSNPIPLDPPSTK